jgi:ketosteroid isomerase-like protein
MRCIALIAAAVALTAVALAGPNEDALMAADKAFAALAHDKGPSAAYAVYAATDVRMFDDGEGVVRGLPNIQRVLDAEYAEGGTVSWAPSEAAASKDGSMGFTIGEWTYVTKGSPDQTGFYVTVWQKDEKGAWKVSVDADTTEVDAD